MTPRNEAIIREPVNGLGRQAVVGGSGRWEGVKVGCGARESPAALSDKRG